LSADAINLYGLDLFGDPIQRRNQAPLADKFGVPPFSVLDARSGEWQDRKRAWLAMGIESELGRKCEGAYGWMDLANNPRAAESTKKIGAVGDGPSVFDPHLCELAYRWFCPPGGQVVDPFAGGSVRGIVAGSVGLPYWGCELRAEQVDANRKQAAALATAPAPVWRVGDSALELRNSPAADFVFSCPPYGDLERYSDDPADLSTMDWASFVDAYRAIVNLSVDRLREDRFACFVIGDFRDKRSGHYRDFVSTTIRAFTDAGAALYNEAILVIAIGSASMRASKQFDAGRKLVKTHQNVLTFVKGDWRKAAAACR